MPNWCTTDYVFEGDKKDLQALYDTLQRIEKKQELSRTSSFGNLWLGNLITELGGKWEDFYCRGYIYCPQLYDDHLLFSTETAWTPMNETMDYVCEKLTSLTYYYQSEEGGCDLYWTNDSAGKYFCRYMVRLCNDGYDECEFFGTQEEAFEYISKNFNTAVKSIADVENLNERLEEKENDDYCYLNEFVNPD